MRSCPSLQALESAASQPDNAQRTLVPLSPALQGMLLALGVHDRVAAGPAAPEQRASEPDCVVIEPTVTAADVGDARAPAAAPGGPLWQLARLLRVAGAHRSAQPTGPWARAAAQVADRASDWQPLHIVNTSALQRLQGCTVVTWEPEVASDGGCGPLLSAREPCHVATIDQIGSADLDADLVTMPLPRTLRDVFATIRGLGALAGCERRACALQAQLRAALQGIAAHSRAAVAASGIAAPVSQRPRMLALRSVQPCRAVGCWLAELVDLAGGELLGAGAGDGSVEVPWARIQAWQPDVLLLLCEGASPRAALPEAGALVERPGWWTLPAVAASAVYVTSLDSMLTPGPGVIAALRALAHMLAPGAPAGMQDSAGSSSGQQLGGERIAMQKLEMRVGQRCRAAFVPQFFHEVLL